jgi:hypothetical protein
MPAGIWLRVFLKRRKFQRSTAPSLLGGTSASGRRARKLSAMNLFYAEVSSDETGRPSKAWKNALAGPPAFRRSPSPNPSIPMRLP